MAEECTTYEDGSWYCSYEDGSETIGLADGSVYDNNTPGGVGSNWFGLVQYGIDAATAIAIGRGSATGVAPQPVHSYPGPIPGVTASAGTSRAGVGGSLNISTNTLMLIAGGVLIFMLGQRRR